MLGPVLQEGVPPKSLINAFVELHPGVNHPSIPLSKSEWRAIVGADVMVGEDVGNGLDGADVMVGADVGNGLDGADVGEDVGYGLGDEGAGLGSQSRS